MRKNFAVIAAVLVSVAAWAQNHRAAEPGAMRMPPAAFTAMQSINPERIRAHTKFLSHDLLEGRGTGQRGGDLAAEYIATQFAAYGLKPAGDKGTYLQRVPMVGITTLPQTRFVFAGPGADSRDLKYIGEYARS